MDGVGQHPVDETNSRKDFRTRSTDTAMHTRRRDGTSGRRVTDLVDRVRGMFLEVPGTRLSVLQAARLSGVEPSVCRHILETLTDSQVLKSGHDGTFTLR